MNGENDEIGRVNREQFTEGPESQNGPISFNHLSLFAIPDHHAAYVEQFRQRSRDVQKIFGPKASPNDGEGYGGHRSIPSS
ncbi:hypothetical protein GCM10025858_34240 [Alicyclobacillus sacchari]|nr:hypothetical protein GCM10025858_34240 [Alicyclobacillus sacchari]